MANTETINVLSSEVATVVATEEAAAQLMGTFGGPAPVVVSNASSANIASEVAATVSAEQQAASIIIHHHANTTPPANTVITAPAGKLTINIVRDTTSAVKWADNPNHVAWDAVLNRVISDLETNLACRADTSFTITVGYTFVDGLAMSGGAIGQSMWFIDGFPYASVKTALQGLVKNPMQATAYAGLPTTWPAAQVFTTMPLGFATGLLQPFQNVGSTNVGWVGFQNMSFDLTPDGSTCGAGLYSLYGVMMHEFTEVLGRACDVPSADYFGDLTTFSGPGVRNTTGSGQRGPSADGNSFLRLYNQNAGGDWGDLAGNPTDAFDAFGTPGFAPSRGRTQPLATADWQIMTLLGWGLSATGLNNAGIT